MVNMHSIFVIILCIIESVLNTDTAQYTGRHSSTYTPENIRICWIGDPVGSSSTQSHRASRFLHGHSDCTSHHIVLFIWSIIIRSVIRKNDYQRMVVLCKWLDMQSTIEIEFRLIHFVSRFDWILHQHQLTIATKIGLSVNKGCICIYIACNMTERNQSDTSMTSTRTRVGGATSIKYATHLPVVIQIKLKPDAKRRSIHYARSDRHGRVDNNNSRPNRPYNARSIVSSSTSESDIVITNKQMRSQNERYRPIYSSEFCQCVKWQIFDRKPYQRRRHAMDSLTHTHRSSSDESYCRCDEIETTPKFIPHHHIQRTPPIDVRRTSKHRIVDKLDKLPSENHQSNSHSHSGKYTTGIDNNQFHQIESITLGRCRARHDDVFSFPHIRY